MISIPRSTIRRFRAVLRRAGLHKPAPAHPPLVLVDATDTTLVLSSANGRVGIAWQLPGCGHSARFLLPQEALLFCEGKSEDPVQFVPGDDRQVQVSWSDRGLPQSRSFTTEPEAEPLVIASPEAWEANDPGFLMALHEAMQTTDPKTTRYGHNSVQLLGAGGAMNATDGGQMLRQTGFRFPWQEDLLVSQTNLCGCREWPHHVPVRIGKTEDWVTLETGSWTIHLAIQTGLRFPMVANIIPPADGITTRLQLDPRDVTFLADTIDRLPDTDPIHHAVTVDLNGHVAVRAGGAEDLLLTELVLQHSRWVGTPVRLSMNRQYLARALALGFREVAISDAERPVLCDDGQRQYVWGVLEGEAVAPSEMAVTIRSPDAPVSHRPSTKPRMSVARETVANKPADSPGPVNLIASIPTTANSPLEIDLITQAEQVRDSLRTTLQAVGTLIGAARRQRKQSRLTKSTLASLKQLQTLRLE